MLGAENLALFNDAMCSDCGDAIRLKQKMQAPVEIQAIVVKHRKAPASQLYKTIKQINTE